MKKSEMQKLDINVSNQLAISWIANGQLYKLMEAIRRYKMPFMADMVYALIRSGNAAYIPKAIGACDVAQFDEIKEIVLFEKLYTEEEWDEILIQGDACGYASDEALVKKRMWQRIKEKGSYNVLAENAKEYPELWDIVDAEAKPHTLVKYKRLQAIEDREMFAHLPDVDGGTDVLIRLGKLKDYLYSYSTKNQAELKYALDFLIKEYDEGRLEKDESWQNVEFPTHVTYSIGRNVMVNLGYGGFMAKHELYYDLYHCEQYELIDWQKYYDNQKTKSDKNQVYDLAKNAGEENCIKRSWWR